MYTSISFRVDSGLWEHAPTLPQVVILVASCMKNRVPVSAFILVACFETALNFKTLKKSLNYLFYRIRWPWTVWNVARGNKMSDKSGLKVDGNRWNVYCLVEEPTAFIVWYIDRLRIRRPWSFCEFVKKKSLYCAGQWAEEPWKSVLEWTDYPFSIAHSLILIV